MESDIEKLPYLQAVVKKTLQLHPPAPLLLPCTTQSSVEFGQYLVPKGARLLVNAWAIGGDATLWSDLDVFIPERILDKEIDFKGRDFEFIPFGVERRMCVGISLAFRMVHLMLASLLVNFDWKLPDGMELESLDMSEAFGLSLAMSIPLRAIPSVN